MIYDIYVELLEHINSPDDIKNFCSQNKYLHNLCQDNESVIARHFLNKYQVDYSDPTNFIYIYNNVKINNYRDDNNRWDYVKIYKLYMKQFNKTKIEISNNVISSFPIYPKMIEIEISDNLLTSFPIQPEMKEFMGSVNELTSFPVQPKMKYCDVEGNQLKSFPIQPKMTYCDISSNQLTSFPVQPKMTQIRCNNNQLTSFPVQPNMTKISAENNPFIYFPVQPKIPKIKYYRLYPSKPN